MHEPLCPLCDHAYKTTEHFLFECQNLKDLRQELLPPMPDIDNTLFCNVSQLINMSKYYFMAHRRRANAHNQAALQRNEMKFGYGFNRDPCQNIFALCFASDNTSKRRNTAVSRDSIVLVCMS